MSPILPAPPTARTGDATIDRTAHPNVGGLLRQRTAVEGEFAGDNSVTCSGR
jgi:hypothetical protein